MRKVRRSALVPHTAMQMFDLVDDVASYPEFLPWCSDAVVHARDDDEVRATLELHKGSLSKRFTTRNRREPGASLTMELVNGPFRHLEGIWHFEGVGDSGSKVSLHIDFEFSSTMLSLMFGSYFEQTCNSLVDDPFSSDRWDYIYYVRIGRKAPTTRHFLTVYFEDGKVARLESRDAAPAE